MAETERLPLPPYMPYKTFTTFLDHLRSVGLPSHVDKSTMQSMSGAMQSWTKSSLRYMNLIDGNDIPDDRLKKLVKAQGEDRKPLLRDLFKSTYAFLNGKVDLSNTTPPKLKDAITALGAQGETVEKIMTFMIAMAKDAGIPLSPYLTKRAVAQRRPKPRQARKDEPVIDAITHMISDPGVQMKTVALPAANGRLTLSGTFNMFDLAGDERELVFAIIDKMKEFETTHPAEDDEEEEEES